jgi:hypothetical protein
VQYIRTHTANCFGLVVNGCRMLIVQTLRVTLGLLTEIGGYYCKRIILSRIYVTINGVWIGDWIYTQLITTSNYSGIANSHALPFTIARTKSS